VRNVAFSFAFLIGGCAGQTGQIVRQDFGAFAQDFAMCEAQTLNDDVRAVMSAIQVGDNGWVDVVYHAGRCAVVAGVQLYRDSIRSTEESVRAHTAILISRRLRL
jgi:hypothetical protein